MGDCESREKINEIEEDIEEEIMMMLEEEESKTKNTPKRYGKGNSKYPKADYQLYPASNVVRRVVWFDVYSVLCEVV